MPEVDLANAISFDVEARTVNHGETLTDVFAISVPPDEYNIDSVMVVGDIELSVRNLGDRFIEGQRYRVTIAPFVSVM